MKRSLEASASEDRMAEANPSIPEGKGPWRDMPVGSAPWEVLALDHRFCRPAKHAPPFSYHVTAAGQTLEGQLCSH